MGVRSSLHVALSSYQEQQVGETHIARSKLLDDHVFHGTTTCAFVFDHGILVAVDSRASMGSYIGSSATEKVLPVSQHILATMAGGAADCAFWIRHLAMQARLYEIENEGQQLTVRRASKLLANNIARFLGKLSMGTMVLGHDSQEGFSIYYVDNDGTRSKGKLFAVGSGSTYAYSILDAGYRPEMSVEEAKELGLRAIRHATYRDAFSGGFVNVYLVQASGWRRIARVDGGFLSVPPLRTGDVGGTRKEIGVK